METTTNLSITPLDSNDEFQRKIVEGCSLLTSNTENVGVTLESSNNCQHPCDNSNLMYHCFPQSSPNQATILNHVGDKQSSLIGSSLMSIPSSTSSTPAGLHHEHHLNNREVGAASHSNETSYHQQHNGTHPAELYPPFDSSNGGVVDYSVMQPPQLSLLNLKSQLQPQTPQHSTSSLFFQNVTSMNPPASAQPQVVYNSPSNGHQQTANGLCGCSYCMTYYSWYPQSYYQSPMSLMNEVRGSNNMPGMDNPSQLNYWNSNTGRVFNNSTLPSNSAPGMSTNMLPFANLLPVQPTPQQMTQPPSGRMHPFGSMPPSSFYQLPQPGRDGGGGYPGMDYLPQSMSSPLGMNDLSSPFNYLPPANAFQNMSDPGNPLHQMATTSKLPTDRMALYTPVYVNQPVPNSTDHFQRKKPAKYRESLQVGWINLYLEVEKNVSRPTENGRIAWLNDMHQIVYTKFTSSTYTRWQYEVEFECLKNLIEFKCDEADWIFNTYPLICKCGERFQERSSLVAHSSKCRESDFREYRCLCGRLFDEQEALFLHIFNGELECGMGTYHLWIFLEKYRKRRYKCTCNENFSNFWVFFVHLAECCDYRHYFMKNCSYWKKDSGNYGGDSGTQTQSGATWPLQLSSPLKSLVFQSKIQ